MTPELTKKLLEDFPVLYRGRTKPVTQSLMAFGFECGQGWYKLLDDLSRKITYLAKLEGLNPEVVQVKEKYGTLRFYCDNTSETMDDLINLAEIYSGYTCEECGERGKTRGKGWVATLCSKHAVERKYPITKWEATELQLKEGEYTLNTGNDEE